MERERIQQLAAGVENIYYEIEQAILVSAAIALSKDADLLENDIVNWRIKKLAEIGPLTDASIRILARYSRSTSDEIKKMLNTAGLEEANEYDGILQELKPEMIASVQPVAQSSAIIETLNMFEARALRTYNKVNSTVLERTPQVYIDVVNKTVGKVLTGVITPREALRQTVSEWVNKVSNDGIPEGIPVLVRKDGVQLSVEGHIPTITRTTVQQVTNGIQDARLDEYEIDLIEISSHLGARKLCAPYQGRVYSRSGNSRLYPPFSSTSYGEIAGIRGINCGHLVYPYVHGRSTKSYKPYGKAENDQAYINSQKQRELERRIRKAKKEKAMMEAMKDEEGIKAANAKIRQRQQVMRTFIETSGRSRRRDREQIVTP